MKRLFKLKGVIQPYSWGGTEFIPGMTGQRSAPGQTAAEYWLGAHPSASSITDDEVHASLYDLIRENKHYFLGNSLSRSHDSLPFLVKILDVKDMLSIQVHPSKKGAVEGYEKEEATGLSFTDASRNYKDANEKAEMMVALDDFWLLHGFRPEKELAGFFATPEFTIFRSFFEEGGYSGLYRHIMLMDQSDVNAILRSLAERVTMLYTLGRLTKDQPDFWAARALKTYFNGENIDRGIFSIYLMNLVHLKRGEGIYQATGVLHAYLEGRNIEVMSNSDNVLRAGLTAKHIDVEELLRHTDMSPVVPKILYADHSTGDYITPADNFLLRISCQSIGSVEVRAPMIILVIRGVLHIKSGDEEVECGRGEALYIVPSVSVSISASGDVEYFMVTVPKKAG